MAGAQRAKQTPRAMLPLAATSLTAHLPGVCMPPQPASSSPAGLPWQPLGIAPPPELLLVSCFELTQTPSVHSALPPFPLSLHQLLIRQLLQRGHCQEVPLPHTNMLHRLAQPCLKQPLAPAGSNLKVKACHPWKHSIPLCTVSSLVQGWGSRSQLQAVKQGQVCSMLQQQVRCDHPFPAELTV